MLYEQDIAMQVEQYSEVGKNWDLHTWQLRLIFVDVSVTEMSKCLSKVVSYTWIQG